MKNIRLTSNHNIQQIINKKLFYEAHIGYTFFLFLSCNLLLSCNNNTSKSEIDYKTDSATTTPSKQGVFNANKFIFLNKNSTLNNTKDYLEKENTPYENYANNSEICRKFFHEGSILTPAADCPDAKFIVIPVLNLNELEFNNVILIFHEGQLAQLMLWELNTNSRTRQQVYNLSILRLKDWYEEKYGESGYENIEGYGEWWTYENKIDSIAVKFNSTHYEGLDNYDRMIMFFPRSNSLMDCAEKSWHKTLKEDNEKKKEVLNRI